MTDVKIDKRKISKSIVKRKMADGTIKEYPQYKLGLTKEFVEEHGRDVILIADSIGIFLPNEEPKVLEKILDDFPEIRKLVTKIRKRKRNVKR